MFRLVVMCERTAPLYPRQRNVGSESKEQTVWQHDGFTLLLSSSFLEESTGVLLHAETRETAGTLHKYLLLNLLVSLNILTHLAISSNVLVLHR